MTEKEIKSLENYFRRLFANPLFSIKQRSKKEDSVEVYLKEEFIGLIYKDEEEEDYNFSMAILGLDLDETPIN